jgi:hypothetical protein
MIIIILLSFLVEMKMKRKKDLVVVYVSFVPSFDEGRATHAVVWCVGRPQQQKQEQRDTVVVS